jgi:hypothetical protein
LVTLLTHKFAARGVQGVPFFHFSNASLQSLEKESSVPTPEQ